MGSEREIQSVWEKERDSEREREKGNTLILRYNSFLEVCKLLDKGMRWVNLELWLQYCQPLFFRKIGTLN